jgi:hypothetical protein
MLVLALVGCTHATTHTPQHIARYELTLAYDSRMQIHAGREPLTEGPQYDGLEHYVRCVPAARAHARLAAKNGRTGVAFAWTGGSLGVLSLVSLAGLAYLESQPDTAWAILGAGIGTSALAVTFAGMSRTFRNHAHGHAVDALNLYNDALGSHGGSCDALMPPAAVLPVPRGAAPSNPRGG